MESSDEPSEDGRRKPSGRRESDGRTKGKAKHEMICNSKMVSKTNATRSDSNARLLLKKKNLNKRRVVGSLYSVLVVLSSRTVAVADGKNLCLAWYLQRTLTELTEYNYLCTSAATLTN